MRILIDFLGGAVVLALSFWLTLVGIDNWPAPDPSYLEVVTQREGLAMSHANSIASSIDVVRRQTDGRLALIGWAVDKTSGQPLSIRALNGGKFDFVAMTKGPREDVTKALHLSPEQTKDVAFSGITGRPVSCELDRDITIVAVDQKKQVSLLASVPIPGC